MAKNSKNDKNEVKYSYTIEKLGEMLKEYVAEHGNGGLPKHDNPDWVDGYHRAVADILFIIS